MSTMHISQIVSGRMKELVAKAKAGEPVEESVRTLLSWFFVYRRSWRNVKLIRETLDAAGLMTVPDFESEYIDNLVSFRLKEEPETDSVDVVTQVRTLPLTTEPPGVAVRTVQLADPAHRIGRLESANRPPVSVSPDAMIEEATTLLLCHDYSQLPVMQSSRDVKGVFSWRSFGSRLALGQECNCVRDAMDAHQEVSVEASLFKAVSIIEEHDCVLVRAHDNTICGIVTAYDINAQFRQLAEPFLLLGDIENHIRYLIGKAFTVEELQEAKDSADNEREIHDVSDLTFGEYIRLLQKPENWAKLSIKIHRKTFTDNLEKIRIIRNDVMHFDPDPIGISDLRLLREFARFLLRWQQLTLGK